MENAKIKNMYDLSQSIAGGTFHSLRIRGKH